MHANLNVLSRLQNNRKCSAWAFSAEMNEWMKRGLVVGANVIASKRERVLARLTWTICMSVVYAL